MNKKKGLVIIIYLAMIISLIYVENITLKNYLYIGSIVLGFYFVYVVIISSKNNKSKIKDKLFNSLIESSDTVYIMMDKNKKIIYLSDNVNQILGIKIDNKNEEQIVSEILNL